jgi:periplasmic divalent cation tolerance protein
MTAEEFTVVLVTAGDAGEAVRIARTLVEERLVACANVIGPVRSIYRWRGVVEEASELLLVLKARAADVETLAARVGALHSYEVPEILALPLRGGAERYLAWLAESTERDT